MGDLNIYVLAKSKFLCSRWIELYSIFVSEGINRAVETIIEFLILFSSPSCSLKWDIN